LSSDIIITDVKDAAKYRELNMTKSATAPDGRPIYDSPAPFDLSLENTSKGGGVVFSSGASKNYYTDHGTYNFSIDYTYQDVTEVNPGNAFVAFEGYSMPANSDFQNDEEYNSEFEIRHSITSSLTWSDEIFGDNMTTVSIAYTGRVGRHYSHTMRSGVADGFGGFSDFASWVGYNSQSLYVPTGENDPLVTYADGFDSAGFWSYVNQSACLSSSKGKISPRHGCDSSWIHRFDVRIMQEIQITDEQAVELTLDIENIGNMLNDGWGRAEGYVQPFNAPVVNAGFEPVIHVDADGNEVVSYDYSHYVYSNFTKPTPTVAKVPSVWKIQLGLRYRF
jgi:hypothetical protein